MKLAPLFLVAAIGVGGCTAMPKAEVLSAEPAGNLPLNEPLLIDDGACPTGLIKRLIYKGPRQSLIRECVRRPAS